MASPTTPARASLGRTGLIAGLLFLAASLAILWSRMPASWPAPLKLHYTVLAMPKGVQDPLIVTGKTGAADFLFLRHEGEGMARIGYDSWGGRGEFSDLFPLPRNGPGLLEVTMPSLLPEEEDPVSGRTHLKVLVDGRCVIDKPVHHYAHAGAISFAQNHAGGSSAAESLRGELYMDNWRMDGPALPTQFRSHPSFWNLVTGQPGRLVALALLAVLFGLAAAGLRSLWHRRASLYPKSGDWGPHAAFLLALLLCLSAYIPLLTYGSGQLVKLEDFGVFFDHQAHSLLHGRLDVPDRAIGGEAFIVDGKRYGYFGITPALLRLPFIVFNVGMEKLSRSYMLGYYCLSLLCVYAFTRHAFRIGRPGGRPPGWAVFSLTLSAGLGSTLFFLGSRSYIYHEAILCGITCALVSMVFTLRWLAEPRRAHWGWALLFAVLAMHARPPSGLFSLSFIATAAAWLWCKQAWQQRTQVGLFSGLLRGAFAGQRPALIILSTGLGVLSFNALGYLKFGVFDGCPLRYHVQYMENPARMARIGNKQFYLENVPFNLDAYLTGRHFLVDRHFPWFHWMNPTDDGNRHSTAHMDIAENTVAMPFSMPAPFWLGMIGIVACLIARGARREIAGVLALSVVPLTAALLAAVAVSHRYTGDFVPFLLLASSLGLACLCELAGRLRILLLVPLLLLVLLSAFTTVALTLNYQGREVWGVDKEVRDRYVRMQQAADRLFNKAP